VSRALIYPKPVLGVITSANGSYHSAKGVYAVSWELSPLFQGRLPESELYFIANVSVPVDCTATVMLPSSDTFSVSTPDAAHPHTVVHLNLAETVDIPGVSSVTKSVGNRSGDAIIVEITSGFYTFEVPY
jgi:hypothetical protein